MSVPNRCAHHHIREIEKKRVLVRIVEGAKKGGFRLLTGGPSPTCAPCMASGAKVALLSVESTKEATVLVRIRCESLDHRALQDDKELADPWACHACQVALSVYHGSNSQAALAHTELLGHRWHPPSPTWAQTSHATHSKSP